MRWLPVCISTMFFCCAATAQQKNYTFNNYTMVQGLPDNRIQSVMQDSRGFLWIGTNEGLSRFDGKSFKNFYASGKDSVVKSNDFGTVYEYKKGHLVINNHNRVICFNTYTEQFYLPVIAGIENSYISKSAKENVYYLESVNRAYLLNASLEITDSIIGRDALNNRNYLVPDYFRPGVLLVQSGAKFYFYYIKKRQFEPIPVNFNLPGKTFFPYFRFYDSLRQQLYFSEYSEGFYRYSISTHKTEKNMRAFDGTPYVTSFVYQVLQKNNNERWFLTAAGIRVLDIRNNSISTIQAGGRNSSLVNNAAISYCIDRDENCWIGTLNGLSKLNDNAIHIASYTDEMNSGRDITLMSVVKGADGLMYTSAYLSKAYRVDTVENALIPLAHPKNTGNWNLFTRGNEIIKTGVGNDLLSYNTKTGQFRTLDFLKPFYPKIELVVMGFVQRNGDEWYCANRGGGFVRRLAGSGIFKTYKKGDGKSNMSNTYYTSFAEDSAGDLWFGVNKSNHLLHWNHLKDAFEDIDFSIVSGTKGISFSGINHIARDAFNNIWVAFDGNGVLKYIPGEKRAILYSIENGLPSNFIAGLQFDNKNRLWIATLKGLSCFLINDGKFVNFKKADGLPADAFTDYCNYFDTAKNLLWVGAGNTLLSFNPDSLLGQTKEQFPVYADEIFINGKRYTGDVNSQLTLSAVENNLQFHFTGIDFNKGKEAEYAYRLSGADKEWVFAGSAQSASYGNLKPGDYLFSARARHKGDNSWNEITVPLIFSIATPWYNTWWFITLLLAVLLLLVFWFIRSYYTRKLERQRNELEKQHAIEQERVRMARELHDGLGSMLSGIKHSFSAMGNQLVLDEIQQSNFRKNIDKLNASIKEIRHISHSIAMEGLLSGGLENSLKDYCNSVNQPEVLEVVFRALDTENISLTEEQAFHLFRITQELLQNIIRHSGATRAIVQIGYNAARLYLTVEDDGAGFDMKAVNNNGIGLKNIQSRIKILKGRMDYRTAPSAGTSVLIEIPCTVKAGHQ